MNWVEGLTLGVAMLGAILGVVNTIWALWRDRVRLKVRPLWRTRYVQHPEGRIAVHTTAYADGIARTPDGRFGIEVINMGLVEVTVLGVGTTTAGLYARHFAKRRMKRFAMLDEASVTALPCRLAPRERVVIWCPADLETLKRTITGATRVYASTACGLDVFATSALFRRLVRPDDLDPSR